MEAESVAIDRYVCRFVEKKGQPATEKRQKLKALVREKAEDYLHQFRRATQTLEANQKLLAVKRVAEVEVIPQLLFDMDHHWSLELSKDAKEPRDWKLPLVNSRISQELCPICRCCFHEDVDDEGDLPRDLLSERLLTKSMEDEPDSDLEASVGQSILKIADCVDHFFHLDCLHGLLMTSSDSFIKCPVCQKIYGIKTGDQPDGQLDVDFDPGMHCEGYPEVGTIIMSYHFPNGVRNGVEFRGTHRVAYVPATDQGKTVCLLLKVVIANQVAFARRLTFTVGTSLTTGRSNVVIWNSIHHKTNLWGGSSNYGYPDATYFSRVLNELAANGVLEKDLDLGEKEKLDAYISQFFKKKTRVKRATRN